MRNVIEGVYSIDYPEDIVWLKDNNVIKIGSSWGGFTVDIEVRTPSGAVLRLENKTDRHDIIFDLDECLNYLYKEDDIFHNNGIWRINVSLDAGSFKNYFNFTFNLYNGCSFTYKTHGTSNIINIYNADELENLFIFSPVAGKTVIDNNEITINKGINLLDLSEIITEQGEYDICLVSAEDYPPLAEITGDVAVTPNDSYIYYVAYEQEDPGTLYGGSLMNRKKIFPICYKLIYKEVCDDYCFGELKYINTDGCYRYIGGKILSGTDNNTTVNYNIPNTKIYNTAPKYKITGAQKILKLGCVDIPKDVEIEDIIYSDNIWIRGIDNEWWDVQLNKTDITENYNEDFEDAQFEIITHKL